MIGQSGDLAGFRDCAEEAWDGTEGALLVAQDNAKDLLDDTAKNCRRSLRTYRRVLNNFYARNLAAYESANALDFETMTATFNRLPKAAKRFANAGIDVLSKCEPR